MKKAIKTVLLALLITAPLANMSAVNPIEAQISELKAQKKALRAQMRTAAMPKEAKSALQGVIRGLRRSIKILKAKSALRQTSVEDPASFYR